MFKGELKWFWREVKRLERFDELALAYGGGIWGSSENAESGNVQDEWDMVDVDIKRVETPMAEQALAWAELLEQDWKQIYRQSGTGA